MLISIRNKKTYRPLVLTAIILSMFMAAIEGTIVSTAMPGIVSELGSFSLFSWVFSSYLLMQAVTILIFGKLSDLFGRKPIFIFGVVVFLIGSFLCGYAQSMEQLILFRFMQGLGAGAVQPIALTIVGDMYSVEERSKIQGYLASVWGISAVIGPALGGIFVQYIDWAWVFWMNIPLGLLSLCGVMMFLHEKTEQKKQVIDYKGAFLLFISITSFMLVLIEGGVRWDWLSLPIVGLTIIGGGGLVLFIIQEKRIVEPMMPLEIWKYRLILLANAATCTSGMIIIGVSSFLPTFVQGVMEETPIVAGFTLTTMSIGWPIASTIAGKLQLKIGYRNTALFGGVLLLIGGLLFVLLTPERGPLWAGAGSFFIGAGMGLSSTPFLVAIQSSVDWKMRGIATASNMFMRILGSSIGAALLGSILNSRLKEHLIAYQDDPEQSLTIDQANLLLDAEKRSNLAEETLTILQDGLTLSLKSVYMGLSIIAIITFVFIILLPKNKDEKSETS
ncbi:MFS transporter [Bacillus taeanensis]|uniref:MFS transporter n=2 Tax=Bacillus taeanensis TaxID=273032 RepID=A0A366XWU1_9BACI|nr:MFS transporter [Bacillus taeanensis]